MSLERKKEKAARDVSSIDQKTPFSEKHYAPAALAQALVIVMCGVFLGGLSTLASSLSFAEIASGTKNTASFIASSVAPTDTPWVSSLYSKVFGEVNTETLQEEMRALSAVAEAEAATGIYTVLPNFPQREVIVASDAGTTEKQIPSDPLEFSDEVQIVVGNDGVQFIEPVFRKSSSTSARFLLVPVMDSQN